MSRKAKIKVKRGKVKFKLKSDDQLLLERRDGIQPLLAASLISALVPEVPATGASEGLEPTSRGPAIAVTPSLIGQPQGEHTE